MASAFRPKCCNFDHDAGPAQWLYAAYNSGGDRDTAGLNYKGEPCPVWQDLPPDVRAKWQAAADAAFKVFGLGMSPFRGGLAAQGMQVPKALR